MSFSIGIIGLPNVGKSTLFKLLTKKKVAIAPYPFTTINPNIGIVAIPDKRLEKIAQIVKPEKVKPATIEFFDIAGLVKNAHRGEGLGNQFLAQVRDCDGLVQVVRNFEEEKVENVLKKVDPKEEIEVIKTELLMKDLETLEKILGKGEKKFIQDKKTNEKFEVLKKIKKAISCGKKISEINLNEKEKETIKEYRFLSQKPIIYLLNGKQKEVSFCGSDFLFMDLKEEEELESFSESEKKELGIFSQLDQLILKCYNSLNLITFYTVTGGKEVSAWTLKKGFHVLEAASKVHSDFEKKFIRGEKIGWQKLIEAGGWKEAKEKGLVETIGKDYIVQDGDVIEFKI